MEKLIIIKTLKELEELQAYLADKDFIAFDTETIGTDEEAQIIGCSVAVDVDTGYYVIFSKWDVELAKMVDLETKAKAKEFISTLVGKNLIMQNAVFDCYMGKNNYGVDLMSSVHTDTMTAGHLLDENRHNGLKELGAALFGEDARKEQLEVKASVERNGGVLTKDKYELYKADAEILARYGAKDAILTLKLFYLFAPQLIEEGLDKFYYDDESMPLLRGPTYDLNTTGLKVDKEALQNLRGELEAQCLEDQAYIYKEVFPHVQDKYKGTSKANTFNIKASQQLSWLLFFKLGNEFSTLTKGGKEVCKALGLKLPYSPAAKREFIRVCKENKGRVYMESKWNPKTKKMARPKKVGDPWKYTSCGKVSIGKLASKYKWVETLLKFAKNEKILNTYVKGIQKRMKYGIIRPSFLQHGTTSGRYSSKNPNFQNLPRDDIRVKGCIISRPGKVFVGADYSQLEPRVFASFSGDERLQSCFSSGQDFYSIIGMEVFKKYDCVPLKEGVDNAFGIKYKKLRNIAKEIALSATYGTTAPKLAPKLGMEIQEAQEVIDTYFEDFSKVKQLMLESHELAKKEGRVTNLFGRPRRMPQALSIKKIYGNTPHSELPYEIRNILNLAINHRIQSTGASIMNRAAIAFWQSCRDLGWEDVKIVMQVHDELIIEAPEAIAEDVAVVLKHCMENTTEVPGVKLEAIPKIAKNLANLK